MLIGGIITAAGLSSRMGQFKPLLPLGNGTLLSRCVSTLEPFCDTMVVVTGREHDAVAALLSGTKAVCLFNPQFAHCQMMDSARLGFSALLGQCDRVLFTPGDVPLFTPDTVRKLLNTPGDLVCPVCHETRGHPIIFSADLLPTLVNFSKPGGLRQALEELVPSPVLLPVSDPGCLLDADIPEDYRRLLELDPMQREGSV